MISCLRFYNFFLLGPKTFVRMAKTTRGGAKRGATAGRAQAPAHNDADEAMEDARAEIDDTTAELDAGASAGESAPACSRCCCTSTATCIAAAPIGQIKFSRIISNQREGSNAKKNG